MSKSIQTIMSPLVTDAEKGVKTTYSSSTTTLKMVFPGETDTPGIVAGGANALYPNYSTTNLPPMSPEDVAAYALSPDKLDPNVFANWHSIVQAAYVNAHGSKTPKRLVIGSPLNNITAQLSVDGKRAIIIENINNKRDLMLLSNEDILALAANDWALAAPFTTRMSSLLGATVDPSSTQYSTEKQSALDSIDLAISAIYSATAKGAFAPMPDGAANMSDADRKLFTDQLAILQDNVESSPWIVSKDIATQVKAIWDRFSLAATFNVNESDGLSSGPMKNKSDIRWGYFSKDGGALVKQGYANIIKQQSAIVKLATQAHDLATGAKTIDRSDLPTLLFTFQLNANLTQEAEIAIDTEQVKQLNGLLATYNDMQNLVNETIKSFGAGAKDTDTAPLSNPENKSGLMDTTKYPSDRIVMMFDNYGTMQKHPLETLLGLTRPRDELVYGNLTADGLYQASFKYEWKVYTKSMWTTIGDQLSAVVTQINQQSQILTDQINSTTKKKDRHFDLGNNALAKMSDMIQSIGRNVS
ncbi:MAG: hypothetical protein ACR652_13615 [Methylocystis sp.]|uniref:hypothetical protein n=1 Tax=Methylocystis sp. TaxID=1911079 RepID=UPI003DA388F1